MDCTPLLWQTTWMGFNQTAVKTVVEEIRFDGAGIPEPPDPRELQFKNAARDSSPRTSRQPRAVLCGSYRRDIPSLVRAYEKLSAAGMRVLSTAGIDFAEIEGFVLNQDEAGIRPEAVETVPLNCIRAADLVWLHAPDGYVGLSGALEIGFANAAGIPVYAEEMPSDTALRPLVTISRLDELIAQTSTGEMVDAGISAPPLRDHSSATSRARVDEHKSAHEITMLISDEIGELARRNPGQRQRLSRTSKTCVASPVFGRRPASA